MTLIFSIDFTKLPIADFWGSDCCGFVGTVELHACGGKIVLKYCNVVVLQ